MYRTCCVLLAALAWQLSGAGDGALDRATLRGVAAVNVVIDPLDPGIEKLGATASELRTRLEQRLREGGIQVDSARAEFVALRLVSVRGARGPFAIAVTVGLYQPVTLVRDRTVKTATQTWEADTLAMADQKQVYRACMESVDDLAGRFVTAYRSVNTAVGNHD